MAAVIKTEKLTKFYGKHRGVIDVDLEINEGEIFGFLGPNGAGKTTTIRVLLDLIRPSSGIAHVFDIVARIRSPSTGASDMCRASSRCTTG
jgi:ABC-2 type transport system ATP-binding protein